MAFSTTRYRLLFKALEIGASAVLLFLCAKAFCSHFYNDLNRLVRKRRAKKLRPRRSCSQPECLYDGDRSACRPASVTLISNSCILTACSLM
jgi:hypothetical protein